MTQLSGRSRSGVSLQTAATDRKYRYERELVMDILRMRMTRIDSSAIARVGYDAAKHILRLEYRSGRIYDYFDVPPKKHKDLLSAESPGEFVNLEIKPNYDYSEVE